ncbi:DUF1538 domain-containing protein [Parasphaerochaeta coccoides]|uniref:DUF1538 domain-containing protein n=1 Tax=Parasphaerochaeta coccoides (strain ATCC BAA-1237 / DSM 17374 / SPN1) TaxID=760011 RepID=F4GLR8_PARC1|nr:DUF1538 domain-containing protein [Parasphaerochaeta coccoides]AEC02462.1 protein of unknown function DUF1538 [Parasphaerochaeta coccoides DSM 17374]
MRDVLTEKFTESFLAVVPIGIIVTILHFTLTPLPGLTLPVMLAGMVLLFLGMVLFSIGVEISMLPIGQHVGATLISSRSMPLIIGVLFVFGFVATMAEPDLSVFADQVASIPKLSLLAGISVGIGAFLVIAVLRVIFHWRLGHVLTIGYATAFIIAFFSRDYLAVAVDASAITTGPVTVPFLLAIGSGFAAVSHEKGSEEDNFGISAICSVGAIISVVILSMFFGSSAETSYGVQSFNELGSVADVVGMFTRSMGHSFLEVLNILAPILVVFLLFHFIKLRLSKRELGRIFVGLGYLLVGMTLFLAGVNSGFLPAATMLGEELGRLPTSWILIPISLVIGACVVLAEPTVYVLVHRVRDITSGTIPKAVLLAAMALGVGIAMSLSIMRIIYDISIWWILLPGYTLSLGLTFFAPGMFVGIGFDAGEVVTGAMSAAFVIPLAIGVASVIPGRNIVEDAFGIAGVLTMIPPTILQSVGLIYSHKLKRRKESLAERAEKEGRKV